MTDVLVICGPTRFHAVDDLATAIVSNRKSRAMALAMSMGWGSLGDEGVAGATAYRKLLDLYPELESVERWRVAQIGSVVRWENWQDGYAVPQCSMVRPGPPVTLAQAESRGLQWSQECAKRNGYFDDPRSLLERASWKQSREAYIHAIGCRTCSMSGIGGCAEFHRIATGGPDTDKPRGKAITI